MALRSAANFKATKNTRFASNTTGQIGADDSQDMFEDVADSFYNKVDDSLTSPSADLYSQAFTEEFYKATDLSLGAFSSGATPAYSSFGVNTTENCLGVIQCSTASSSTGGSLVAAGQNQIAFGNGFTHTLRWRSALETLSDGTDTYKVWIGFGDNTSGSGEPTDGCFFRYTHSVNSGKWEAVTRQAGTETATDTTVTADVTTFHIFQIIVNSTGTSVEFYIDGTLRATNTTNIPGMTGPQLTGYVLKIEKSAGTNARSLYADYVQYVPVRTAAR